MVMIEAMACGTPVVALRRGSVPEVVPHGIAGLVLDDYADFAAALNAAADIDPASCRRHVESCFDLPIMAAGYEQVYRTVAEQHQVGAGTVGAHRRLRADQSRVGNAKAPDRASDGRATLRTGLIPAQKSMITTNV
jgi:hypothetical protein